LLRLRDRLEASCGSRGCRAQSAAVTGLVIGIWRGPRTGVVLAIVKLLLLMRFENEDTEPLDAGLLELAWASITLLIEAVIASLTVGGGWSVHACRACSAHSPSSLPVSSARSTLSFPLGAILCRLDFGKELHRFRRFLFDDFDVVDLVEDVSANVLLTVAIEGEVTLDEGPRCQQVALFKTGLHFNRLGKTIGSNLGLVRKF